MEKEIPRSTTPSRLPPGCRFRPSDHQLLSDYLVPKNSNPDGCSHLIIGEIEFYDLGPSQLPDSASFWFGRLGRRQHWFYFVKRNRKGKSRVVEGRGRWRRRGKARDVVVEGNVLGTRTAFVFHEIGGLGNAVRTDWVLHEYALTVSSDEVTRQFIYLFTRRWSCVYYSCICHHLIHSHAKYLVWWFMRYSIPRLCMAPFVLCRVFHKHHTGNHICQGVMNLNGEPSALAISHHDTQIDRDIRLNPAGGDINNTIHSNSVVSVELNFHINNGPAAPDVEPLGLVRSPEISLCAGLVADDSANHDIISIMEEGFLELNDLADPLLGNVG